jgi:hypothetical protein
MSVVIPAADPHAAAWDRSPAILAAIRRGGPGRVVTGPSPAGGQNQPGNELRCGFPITRSWISEEILLSHGPEGRRERPRPAPELVATHFSFGLPFYMAHRPSRGRRGQPEFIRPLR